MFEMFKRYGGLSHKELASLVLSGRPLSNGRSPLSRASDRTWLSRLVVNAPVGSLQPQYFRDFGMATQRVMDRLRSNSRGEISSGRMIDMVCGDAGKPMEYALAACHQDVTMYRNALDRYAGDEGRTPGERAEAVMVLFVAAACTANVPAAVAYANSYVASVLGGRMRTPVTLSNVTLSDLADSGVPATALGLMRVANGYISGVPFWVDPGGEGAVIGSMAMGAHDITEVEADVSAEHARVWCEEGVWNVRDLGSRNGSRLLNGATGEEVQLAPGEPVQIGPGDELSLGAATTFMAVVGTVGA